MPELTPSPAMLAGLRLALSSLERDIRMLGDGTRLGLSAAEIGLLEGRADKYRSSIARMEARLRRAH